MDKIREFLASASHRKHACHAKGRPDDEDGGCACGLVAARRELDTYALEGRVRVAGAGGIDRERITLLDPQDLAAAYRYLDRTALTLDPRAFAVYATRGLTEEEFEAVRAAFDRLLRRDETSRALNVVRLLRDETLKTLNTLADGPTRERVLAQLAALDDELDRLTKELDQ